MTDSFDKTQTGIQTGPESAAGKAGSQPGQGGLDKKKAIIAGGAFLAMLGVLFALSQVKAARAAKKPNADEAQIQAKEAAKKGELKNRVDNLEQAPLGKDAKFDEAGNFLGPSVQNVELPENKKSADLKAGTGGTNEKALDELALPEQKTGQYSNFSGNYQPSNGRHGEESDPSVMREQRAGQKEERELIASSMLGYSRNRVMQGPSSGGFQQASMSPADEAAAKKAALMAQVAQIGQSMGQKAAPGMVAPGMGGETGYIAPMPGAGRSFTRPGEVADMRIYPGEYVKVPEGKSLECVLVNQVLAQAHQSPVIVTVSRDFLSSDGRLLVPAGARLVGMADRIEDMNQERMFQAFNRIDFPGPNGETAWFPERRIPEALSPNGALGVEGKVKRGIMKALMSSIALGVVQGMGAAAAGPITMSTTTGITTITPGQQAVGKVSDNLNRFSERVLSRYMNMVPQVILKPGTRIRVYLSEDTLMSVYRGGDR